VSPRDSSFAPASRFVADFVGTMNCLHGTSRDGPQGSLAGRVLSSFFLGDRTRPVVEGVGRTPIVVETVASREFKVGQSVHLKIDPDALLVLDR